MNEPAIVCQNLSKHFTLSDGTVFKALDEVNITISKGSFVGVVGKNGCGKSTLLKILAGILKPTTGKVTLYGKVLSVLDVGTGFHPEMSGLENVFLVGKLFGLSNKEIEVLVPEVLSFSEIGDFIKQPVKHYSQGMYLRLAVALQFYLKADIYLFDEVIAVGDATFKKKCFNKIKELATSGATVVFVSHTFDEIAALCDRCIVLSLGKIEADGSPDEVYEKYKNSLIPEYVRNDVQLNKGKFTPLHHPLIDIYSFEIYPKDKPKDRAIRVSDAIVFNISYNKKTAVDSTELQINIFDTTDRMILSTCNVYGKAVKIVQKQDNITELGLHNMSCVIPASFFNTGEYYAQLRVSKNRLTAIAETTEHVKFAVVDQHGDDDKLFFTYSPSPIRTGFTWELDGG